MKHTGNFLLFLLLLLMSPPVFSDPGPEILYEQDTTLLTTAIRVHVFGGSVHDPKKRSGTSDFLSSLLLRGTKGLSRTKFQAKLESIGGTMSAQASRDAISISGGVIKENTEAFFELLESAMTEPDFNAKEFSALKREVLAAIRYTPNNNGALAGLAFRQTIYQGTPLADPVSGSLSSVGRIQLKDIIESYRKYFNQNNLVFAVVSPLPRAQIQPMIEKLWKKLPQGQRFKSPHFEAKVPRSPQIVVVHKPKASSVVILAGQPSIEMKDEDRWVLGLGNFSFGGEAMVSRLFRIIRAELGWTYAISSQFQAADLPSPQKGFALLWTTPSAEFAAKTLLKMLSLWDSYYDFGLKNEEWLLSRQSSINSYPFNFDSAGKRLGNRLEEYLYGVPTLSPEDYAAKLESLNNHDLKKALQSKLTKNQWTISMVGDKDVIGKQLEQEQQQVPASKRLKINRVVTPGQLID